MKSRARLLYEEIVTAADPIVYIENIVSNHWSETDYLDFKTVGSERDNKHNWSQALSGFANTEGGVVIWGIDARGMPSPDGTGRKIDAAADCRPLGNPVGFVQLLKDIQLQAVVEPLHAIEMQHWSTPAGPGYVVCYVPEGRHKPYRATLHPEQQYWQRIGDKFVIISHSLLRSLFYPRLATQVSIRVTPEDKNFIVQMVNIGEITAEEVFVVCELDAELFSAQPISPWAPAGYHTVTIERRDLMWPLVALADSKRHEIVGAYSAAAAIPLHPGQQAPMLSCQYRGQADKFQSEFRFAVYMRNQSALYFRHYVWDGMSCAHDARECSRDGFKTLGPAK